MNYWGIFFTYSIEDRKANPLLAIPEVQHASLLDEALNIIEPERYEDIYYAAVKEISRKQAGIGIFEADTAMVPLLKAKGVGSTHVAGILSCSPRVRHLNKFERLTDSNRFIEHVQGGEKEREAVTR